VAETPESGASGDIIAHAPVGITVCAPATPEIVYVNECFEAMTGHTESDLRGDHWTALTGPDTDDQALASVERAIDREAATTVELRLYGATDEPFWDRVRLVPIEIDSETTRLVSFHEDISDEYTREDALEALHGVATHIQTDETIDAVATRTVDAAVHILDFDMCSVVLREGDWLVPRANSADAPPGGSRRMRVDQGLAGETYQTGESYLIDDVVADETSKPAKDAYRSAISVPIGDRGVFQAVKTEPEWFDEDDLELTELLVTHTASAIERIEREQDLQRQNERLASFVGVVSHDLRNPMNILAGALDLAERTGDTEHFERGQRALDRMDQLLEDLLALARQGEDIEATSAVALEDLVEASWETVETADATFTVETDTVLQCHPGRLKQLFENLFRNAVEHGGESVTVTVGDLPGEDGFYVADDGPGIPEENRQGVFESGYTTSRDGTGFGLSIVAEIVAAHDWAIDITESESGGARFEITGVTFAS